MKILITTEGGIVQSVCSDNPDLEIVVVDYDKNAAYDEKVLISGIRKPDDVFPFMYELVNPVKSAEERVVYETLRDLNF